jgi:predicted phage-related endonuclease
MIERIPIDPVAEPERWHALRAQDVTASVVPALFDLAPYKTNYALYLEKAGLWVPPPIDGVMLRRGREFEELVGRFFGAEHPEWVIEKAKQYVRDPQLRLGCTPDFYFTDARGLRGVIQAKIVARSIFRARWLDGLPPPYVYLQCLCEAMLTDASYGIVAALVFGEFTEPDYQEFHVPRHEPAEKRLAEATVNFWMDIDGGRMPAPDYRRDSALIAAMYPKEKTGKQIDLRGTNEAPVLLDERDRLVGEIKARDDRKEEIEARIKEILGDAERGIIDGYGVTWRQQTRKAHQVKETTFRQLRITKEKAKEELV